MKLILRKNDSATSLLLFIYNNYLTTTKRDSLKLSSLLEILKVFDKNETAIRMSLSRATKAGILLNRRHENEVSYTLTELGKASIEKWNKGVERFWERYRLRNSEWNGKWYSINIDSKEERKPEFIDELQQMGFAQINTNTWISPYHQCGEVEKLADLSGLKNGITEIYGELKIYKSMERFCEEVYELKRLKAPYINFIEAHREKLAEIPETYEKEQYKNEGQTLPLLHELGWNFFKISSEDPLLPKLLYPIWEGDEAVAIMREYRELLLQSAVQYLEKFN